MRGSVMEGRSAASVKCVKEMSVSCLKKHQVREFYTLSGIMTHCRNQPPSLWLKEMGMLPDAIAAKLPET